MAIDTETPEPERPVAVITGASSGIGQATALEFAQQGFNVVLAGRRRAALQKVAADCEAAGVLAVVAIADTTDENQVKRVAERTRQSFGHFDVWINNAAVSLFATFEEAPHEDFHRVIDTNFFGYVNGAREAIRQFKEQGYGTLINVTSLNATTPQPYTSAYNASKFAIRGLTESIRMELEVEGYADAINICNAMPASTDTHLFQNAANYTGRQIQALEPVYDAAYVAKQIVKLVRRPKREVTIGPAGKLMYMEFAHLPKLYEKFAARIIDRNHLGNRVAEDTAGNLYHSLPGNTGISGGWRNTRLRADKFNVGLGAIMAIIVGTLGLNLFLSIRKSK